MTERHCWTEKERQVLIETHRTHSTYEQADLLGITRHQVREERMRLRRKNLIHDTERKCGRHWSDDEIEQLRLLILDGNTNVQVARKLHRTRDAIERQVANLGGFAAIRSTPFAHVRTLAQVSQLFGAWPNNPERAQTWVTRGWLTCSKRYKYGSPKAFRYVTDDALRQFMTVQDAWVSYTPAEIVEPDWRLFAHEQRSQADGEWWSLARWSKHCHYSTLTMQTWCQRGWLSAIRRVKWDNHWYVWSADAQQFVPPSERRYAAKQASS